MSAEVEKTEAMGGDRASSRFTAASVRDLALVSQFRVSRRTVLLGVAASPDDKNCVKPLDF